ncbi:hypothetical protein ABPG72_011741 [Tetrahymena utriculariae]
MGNKQQIKIAQQKTYYDDMQEFLNSSLKSHTHLHINLEHHKFDNKNKFNCKKFKCESSSMPTLTYALSQCSNLINFRIDLRETDIGIQEVEYIKSFIGNFKNISELQLNFEYNQICDKSVQILSNAMLNFDKLTFLQLEYSGNLISDQGITSLASMLSKLQKLRTLNLCLGRNQVSDEGACILSKQLSKLTELTTLEYYLWANKISDKGACAIGQGLSECKNLLDLKLSLSRNQISDEGASCIGKGISKCSNIEKLLIYLWQIIIYQLFPYLNIYNQRQNNIGDLGIQDIREGLSCLKNLLYLDISIMFNQFSDQGEQSISKTFPKLEKLIQLELYLSKNEAFLKSDEIINCKNIKVLTLDVTTCSHEQKIFHQRKAFKIKRLVKLNMIFF